MKNLNTVSGDFASLMLETRIEKMTAENEDEVHKVESIVCHRVNENGQALFRIQCEKGNLWTLDEFPYREAFEKGYVTVRLDPDPTVKPEVTRRGHVIDRRAVATLMCMSSDLKFPSDFAPQELARGNVKLLDGAEAEKVFKWRQERLSHNTLVQGEDKT